MVPDSNSDSKVIYWLWKVILLLSIALECPWVKVTKFMYVLFLALQTVCTVLPDPAMTQFLLYSPFLWSIPFAHNYQMGPFVPVWPNISYHQSHCCKGRCHFLMLPCPTHFFTLVHALEGQCLTYRTPLEQFPGAPFVPCRWCTLVPTFCNLTRSKLLKTLSCPRCVVHFLLQPLCHYCSALHCRQINFRVRFQSEKLWNKWDFDNPRKHCEEKRATCAGV